MKRLTTCLALGIVAVLTGCGSSKDVTSAPGSRTDFVPGQIYRVKKPVFLFKFDAADRKEIIKVAKLGFAGTPSSLAEFEAEIGRNSQVRGLLRPDEQIRVTKFVEDSSPTLGTFFVVFGVIASGEHKGTAVQLNLISREGRPTRQAFVDPEYLSAVP
jgi:hypothetical protein